jgi:hypothetical protein
MPEALQASRALLFPGPLAPLSHFGVTLLRQAVASGLRYSFYHLGLPLPEPPPVRIVGLRLYLDGPALAGLVAAEPGGPAVAAAALDPAGDGGWPPGSGRVRAAAAFHRLRLLAERQPPRRARAAPADPERLWKHFRGELSRLLTATNDALLAEIVCSLTRRARRAAGKEAPPCLSLAAWRLCRGGRVPLGRFGPPDPLRPSWARAPERVPRALEAIAGAPLPPRDSRRGRFREVWRLGLDRLGAIYFDLARSAVERGALSTLEGAFFLPFAVAEDLAGATGGWLAAAAERNRREHAAALIAPEPPELLTDSPAEGPGGPRPDWEWAPLLPLP